MRLCLTLLLMCTVAGCCSADYDVELQPTPPIDLGEGPAAEEANAWVRVTTITRVVPNEGGPFEDPWDEIYFNVERFADWRPNKKWFYQKPPNPAKNHWNFDNMFNRPDTQHVNEILWRGHIPDGELLMVHLNLREYDKASPNDSIGHFWVVMRNVDGNIAYRFNEDKHAKKDGVDDDGDQRFRLTGDGSVYIVHVQNPSFVKRPKDPPNP